MIWRPKTKKTRWLGVFLSRGNRTVVSNGQRPLVTSARLLSLKLNRPIIAYFFIKFQVAKILRHAEHHSYRVRVNSRRLHARIPNIRNSAVCRKNLASAVFLALPHPQSRTEQRRRCRIRPQAIFSSNNKLLWNIFHYSAKSVGRHWRDHAINIHNVEQFALNILLVSMNATQTVRPRFIIADRR